MKTILVPTDFSPAADNAARYALHIARCIKADVKLCNAVNATAEAHMASQLVWPVDDYSTEQAKNNDELKVLAKRLSLQLSLEKHPATTFEPQITYTTQVGGVTDTIKNLAANHDVSMVAMGLWGAGGINRFFAGSNSREMIDRANFPLLLVPPTATFKTIHTIAFATNLSDSDIDVIHSLASLAREFNAEILLVHVMDEKAHQTAYQNKVSTFLSSVCDKANYPKIYYRDVKSKDVDQGLNWLLEHRELEILAMVHRKHDLLERLFNESHTQHMARHSELPILVFPDISKSNVF
jgi:nucleotide-binding universal stress UspA family protein